MKGGITMTRKCTKLWCWGCGKAPSGETGEPPFCLGCGEMVGECGMSAGPCGLCLDHCLDEITACPDGNTHEGIRGLSVPERRQKLIDDEARDFKKLEEGLKRENLTTVWDEIEHQLMEDLYGVRLDSLDLGLSEAPGHSEEGR